MKSKKIKFLISYLKYEKGLLFFGAFLCIVVGFISAYLPIIISNVINTNFSDIKNFNEFIFYNGTLYLGLSFCMIGLTTAFKSIFAKMSSKLASKIQLDLSEKMQKLEMNYFDSASAGDLVSRFTNDTDTIRNLYGTTFIDIFTIVVNIVIILAVVIRTNVYMFLIIVIYLPVMYFVSKFYAKKIETVEKNIRKKEGITSSIYNESLKALQVVQIFANEKNLKKSFDEQNEEVKKLYIKRAVFNATFSFNFSRFVLGLSNILLILVFSLLKYNAVYVNIGLLYLIITYNQRILNLYGHFLFQINGYKASFVACDRILKILEVPFEKNGNKKIDLEGNLEFRDIYFEYKKDIPVLKDVNFKLEKGKSIAFVGATGSGKSTIMNLVLGFYENQRGEILVENNELKSLDKKYLREQMAIVLQEPYIFTSTISENISMGNEKISKEEVVDAIIKVGGKELLEKREQGVDTFLNENGKELSLGEKQILCFARAIVRNPKILILDEATSNIDTETEKIINYGIEVLKKNRSTIIIAHRLSTIKDCDTIAMLEDGKIIEVGNHNELMNLCGKYKQWYEIQSSKKYD